VPVMERIIFGDDACGAQRAHSFPFFDNKTGEFCKNCLKNPLIVYIIYQ